MSRRLPTLSPRKVIRALERSGFILHRIKGSHHHFIHPNNDTLLVVVPYHGKDLPRSLVHAIIKQAGLTVDAFIDRL